MDDDHSLTTGSAFMRTFIPQICFILFSSDAQACLENSFFKSMREASVLVLSEILHLDARGSLIHEHIVSQSYLSPESVATLNYVGNRTSSTCREQQLWCWDTRHETAPIIHWCGKPSAEVLDTFKYKPIPQESWSPPEPLRGSQQSPPELWRTYGSHELIWKACHQLTRLPMAVLLRQSIFC